VDDSRFNHHYHVRHTHLPHPGDERQLKRLCGQIASQRLDPEKPLWELHVVEGLAEGGFALVVKVHQSLARGLWGLGLVEALLSPEPAKGFERGPAWLPRPSPDGPTLAREAVLRRLGAPLHLGRRALAALRDAEDLGEEARRGLGALLDPKPASPSPLNRRIGPHRRLDWQVLDARKARDLAKHFQTSLEAVALATLAGGLGCFFEQRGLPQPDQRDLRFCVAYPGRAGGVFYEGLGRDALAWRVATLPIAERDARRRLQAVDASLADARPTSFRLFAAASEYLGTGVMGVPLRRQLGQGASNLTFTHLAGPSEPRYLLGARLSVGVPMLPLVPEQALRVGLYRYTDSLCWGLNADWDLLPDLHDLALALTACFGELVQAVGSEAA